MKVRRFERMDGIVSTYIHGGGSVGVMVGFDVADESKASAPEFDAMGKNVAMQIAAMSPAYLDEASVPAEVVEHEKSILAAQMKEDPKMASKPEAVLAKIAAGKMGKYYKENCLVDQEFVRSDLFQGSVKGYVDSVAKELGTEIKLNGFIRMMKGDGLEKREENFAEEIAKQINGESKFQIKFHNLSQPVKTHCFSGFLLFLRNLSLTLFYRKISSLFSSFCVKVA